MQEISELLVHKDEQFIVKFAVLGFPNFLVPSQLAFHPRQIHCTTQLVPQFHFSSFRTTTKLMQSLCHGNYALLGFAIGTHNTLAMPVVLRGTYKDTLVTKKSCNWLSLSLGNKPLLWLFHYLGFNHQESGFSIGAIGHRCLIQVHYHIWIKLPAHCETRY